jgi:hypothetical protein
MIEPVAGSSSDGRSASADSVRTPGPGSRSDRRPARRSRAAAGHGRSADFGTFGGLALLGEEQRRPAFCALPGRMERDEGRRPRSRLRWSAISTRESEAQQRLPSRRARLARWLRIGDLWPAPRRTDARRRPQRPARDIPRQSPGDVLRAVRPREPLAPHGAIPARTAATEMTSRRRWSGPGSRPAPGRSPSWSTIPTLRSWTASPTGSPMAFPATRAGSPRVAATWSTGRTASATPARTDRRRRPGTGRTITTSGSTRSTATSSWSRGSIAGGCSSASRTT